MSYIQPPRDQAYHSVHSEFQIIEFQYAMVDCHGILGWYW